MRRGKSLKLKIENGELKIMNTGYAVYDVLGQRVLEGTLNGKETIVNISSLTKGIYFVRVGDEARKVVKIEN
jgi:hypothetical protein